MEVKPDYVYHGQSSDTSMGVLPIYCIATKRDVAGKAKYKAVLP